MRKFFNKLMGRKEETLAVTPYQEQQSEILQKATGIISDQLRSLFQEMYLGNGLTPQMTYRQGMVEGHHSNPVVYACAKKISSSAQGIPLQVMVENSGDEEDAVLTDGLLNDLLKRPNKLHSMSYIIGFTMLNLLYGKRAYLVLNKLGNQQSLWPLVPDAVELVMGRDGKPSHYIYYQENGRNKRYELDQVLAVWTINPLNMYEGTSVLDPARASIRSHNLASKHSIKTLETGARIPGVLTVDGELSDEVIEKLQKFKDGLTGPENTGNMPVLDNSEAKFINFGHSPKDIDFVKGKELPIYEICMVMGVDPILIWPTQSSYNNKSEAKRSLYEDTVVPTLQYLLDELNQFIQPFYKESGKRFYIGMDLSKVPALQQNRGEKWKNDLEALKWGGMNRATFAGRNGLPVPTDKASQRYYQPASQVPVEGFEAKLSFEDDE